MGAPRLYPLLFSPIYKDYPWGGRWLESAYGRALPGPIAAESWEIADRPEGMSLVANGPEAGAPLGDLVARWGERLVGGAGGSRFPLLCKILDARERLSLQVHPDEAGAQRTGGEPKSEMWVALGADPGARVLVGLRPGVDRASFERALAEGRVEACLGSVVMAPGTVVAVPGGRLHAIDAGCRLYEIQQNSDTTYRVHDWGRPRPLHLREALEVIAWDDVGAAPAAPRPLPGQPGLQRWELVRTKHFQAQRLLLTGALEARNDGGSFHIFFLIRGRLSVVGGGMGVDLTPGTTCLLPAALSAYVLEPQRPDPAELLRVTL